MRVAVPRVQLGERLHLEALFDPVHRLVVRVVDYDRQLRQDQHARLRSPVIADTTQVAAAAQVQIERCAVQARCRWRPRAA